MTLAAGSKLGPYEILSPLGAGGMGKVYTHTHHEVDMRTNIVLDDALVAEAFRHSAAKTKKGLVDEALRELIRVRHRRSLRDLKGRVRFAEGYDHKALRTAR
ncbi:MAG: type II toxin-antitoxin system VapB family antitoxin [Thermoanaerobaculia bacterium]